MLFPYKLFYGIKFIIIILKMLSESSSNIYKIR